MSIHQEARKLWRQTYLSHFKAFSMKSQSTVSYCRERAVEAANEIHKIYLDKFEDKYDDDKDDEDDEEELIPTEDLTVGSEDEDEHF